MRDSRNYSDGQKKRFAESIFKCPICGVVLKYKGRHLEIHTSQGCVPWNEGKSCSDEIKKKISDSHKGLSLWPNGRVFSEKTKEKLKNLWKTPDFVAKQMKSRGVKPNRAEMKLSEILKPFGFEFVGDGKHIVGGKLPDFWDGGNKLIELFGDYWHKGQDPQDRIDFFRSRGYDCLIIWERELKDINKIKNRILEFYPGEGIENAYL